MLLIRKWMILELAVVEILILTNHVPQLATMPFYSKVLTGIQYCCSLFVCTFLFLSFKYPQKWLNSLAWVIQIFIIKKELILASPFGEGSSPSF